VELVRQAALPVKWLFWENILFLEFVFPPFYLFVSLFVNPHFLILLFSGAEQIFKVLV